MRAALNLLCSTTSKVTLGSLKGLGMGQNLDSELMNMGQILNKVTEILSS